MARKFTHVEERLETAKKFLKQTEKDTYRKNIRIQNKWANAGLILGVVSIFFAWIGIIPLSGIVVSVVALNKSKKLEGAGRTKAIIGLILSTLYMLVNLYQHGHLNF